MSDETKEEMEAKEKIEIKEENAKALDEASKKDPHADGGCCGSCS